MAYKNQLWISIILVMDFNKLDDGFPLYVNSVIYEDM